MSERAPKTMTVPEVRDRLYEMSEIYRMPELRQLADQLWRRRPGRKPVRPQSRRVTPELREAIREFARGHPGMPEDRIGDHFGVNQGRVSEALFGFRK